MATDERLSDHHQMRLAAALSALAVSGCSVVFMTDDTASRVPGQRPNCTEGKALPAVDGLATVAYTVLAFMARSAGADAEMRGESVDSYNLLIIGDTIGAIAHGLSAFHGINKVDACRAKIRAWEDARQDVRP